MRKNGGNHAGVTKSNKVSTLKSTACDRVKQEQMEQNWRTRTTNQIEENAVKKQDLERIEYSGDHAELLVVPGKLGTVDVEVLIDSGAQGNFVN